MSADGMTSANLHKSNLQTSYRVDRRWIQYSNNYSLQCISKLIPPCLLMTSDRVTYTHPVPTGTWSPSKYPSAESLPQDYIDTSIDVTPQLKPHPERHYCL
jgi:hypothetical protein